MNLCSKDREPTGPGAKHHHPPCLGPGRGPAKGTETLGLNPSLGQQLATVQSRTRVRCVHEKLHSPRVAAQGEPKKIPLGSLNLA